MNRRNFIQALIGVAAGMAGAGAALKPSKQQISTGFSLGMSEAQRELAETLKECRVVCMERSALADGRLTAKITYRHAPRLPKTRLDKEAAEFVSGGRVPVTLSVTQNEDALIDLNGYLHPVVSKPSYSITVEWV